MAGFGVSQREDTAESKPSSVVGWTRFLVHRMQALPVRWRALQPSAAWSRVAAPAGYVVEHLIEISTRDATTIAGILLEIAGPYDRDQRLAHSSFELDSAMTQHPAILAQVDEVGRIGREFATCPAQRSGD